MAEITLAAILGWIVILGAVYTFSEYLSVIALGSASKIATGVGLVKGKPFRRGSLGLGGFFAGAYAHGFLVALVGSLGASAGSMLAGEVLLGLTLKQTVFVGLLILVVGLSLYTGAAAEEAVDAE